MIGETCCKERRYAGTYGMFFCCGMFLMEGVLLQIVWL